MPHELVSAENAPEYMRMPFILDYYRPCTHSYTECLRSLLYIHNETGNIYSHLVPAVGTLLAGIVVYSLISESAGGYVVMSLFLLTAVACFSLSSFFHTFVCHSEKASVFWLRMDFVGIVLLIVGSLIPSIYYGFYCFPHLQIIYSSITLFFGILTLVISILPKFHGLKYKPLRLSLFLGLGFSGLVPIGHSIGLLGFHFARSALSFDQLIIMAGLYVIGCYFYVTRYPEKRFPGKFDVWLNSHTIMHLFVVAAALTHFVGILKASAFWMTQKCPIE